MNERSVGTLTEERASEYMTKQGYTVLARNYRAVTGEIDLITQSPDGTIVFAEVKYRRSDRYGLPEEAVSLKKQETIRRTALWYLRERKMSPETAVRFDVIAMDTNEIRWYRDAF
ncbi:MAG: YraN family protein [Lachnospiraceae bacterium]|nr:YraN family protein [Lachnospiraceae bacterium]